MAGDPLQKIKESTSRAITKISVKTSSTLEKSKIKMQIENLTKESNNNLLSVGYEVYSLWEQGVLSIESLIVKLEEIQKLRFDIAQLEKQLESIDERDSEILGTKNDTLKEISETNMVRCSQCGAEFVGGAKFCRKCGNRLDA